MKVMYGNSTFAPNLKAGEYNIQIELFGGTQWRKGFATLNLTETADSVDEAKAKFMKYVENNDIMVKCPKDRKLSLAIQGSLISVLRCNISEKAEKLINGPLQVRVAEKRYQITWLLPDQDQLDVASDLNYALKA